MSVDSLEYSEARSYSKVDENKVVDVRAEVTNYVRCEYSNEIPSLAVS